jgi:hypothetical protein
VVAARKKLKCVTFSEKKEGYDENNYNKKENVNDDMQKMKAKNDIVKHDNIKNDDIENRNIQMIT